MHELRPGTKLRFEKYKIIKCLSQNDFEISYLATESRFFKDREVVVTEFFMKGICERDGRRVTMGDQDVNSETIHMRDKFINDAKKAIDIIDCFYENDTAYSVKLYKKNEAFDYSRLFAGLQKDYAVLVVAIVVIASLYFFISYIFTKENDSHNDAEVELACAEEIEPEIACAEEVEEAIACAEEVEEAIAVTEATVEIENPELRELLTELMKIKVKADKAPIDELPMIIAQIVKFKEKYGKSKQHMTAEEQNYIETLLNQIIEVLKSK